GEDEGVSMELCGGTHVDTTAEIGNFRVVNETSSAAGVRRIEVLTGRAAEELVETRFHVLDEAASLLHTRPEEVGDAVKQLAEQHQALQKELAQMRQKLAQQESANLLSQATQVDGFNVLATQVDVPDVDTMRQMTDWFRDKLGSAVIVLGAVVDEKPMLVASVTQDLIDRGMHAGNLVRDAAKLMGGGGGGRPNMAQAGGKDAGQLPAALASVSDWVNANLKG
ncbi:MAG: alanine--tRNA ligase, partial [Caldilineaceae bacterium]|nr:alanine--tRNA ligase [Caldilineaceae bacterium]